MTAAGTGRDREQRTSPVQNSSIERYSMSTYAGVTNFQKQSGFLAHTVGR